MAGLRPSALPRSGLVQRRFILAAQQLQTIHRLYQLLASRMQIPSCCRETLVVHKTLNDS
jgi:hypothetical protein